LQQNRKDQLENTNYTKTNKFIGSNVVEVQGDSYFPIHLVTGGPPEVDESFSSNKK